MERRRQEALHDWSRRDHRKPLVLRGARQVGKSYLVREFGRASYDRLVELNLEREPALAACFGDNDPVATLRRLEAVARVPIGVDGRTLLFLDEIQAEPAVLARLRWFAEELPALPVVAAGSLLDFTLRAPAFSMPVGRISFLHLEPMGFFEFLEALGEGALALALGEMLTWKTLVAGSEPLGPLHARALDLFAQYLLVGGMPAAVSRYASARSLAPVAEIHAELLATLRADFGKYAARAHHGRLDTILAAAARQVGGKFTYRRADPEDRGASLKQAVELLCRARICHRIVATAATGVPLGAGADERRFKLALLDVGLLSAQLGLDVTALVPSPDLMLAHRGALAEQAVGQLLRLGFHPYEEPALHYWHREARGAEAEVDYVIAHGDRVLPVEVKAGATGSLRSLHLFQAARGGSLAIRFNADRPSITEVAHETPVGPARYRLLSLPLYAVELLPALVASAG